MNRRALMIALVVTALGAAVFILFLRRFEEDRSGGAMIAVVVAKRAIDRGHVITNDDLAVRHVPRAYVETRAVRASDRQKIVDLRTSVPVSTQEVVLWTDLEVASPPRRDLSSLVMPGHRAVFVRAMREDEGSALIRPGDYVDVIGTLSDGPPGLLDSKTSMVLLQKALVLANGTYTSATTMAAEKNDKTRTPLKEQGLTLSLNLQQAQLIALAAESGTFSVALRGPDEARTGELLPDVTASALLDKTPRAPTSAKRAPADTAVRLTSAPPRSTRNAAQR
jgi:pilus assembly protein CpaB